MKTKWLAIIDYVVSQTDASGGVSAQSAQVTATPGPVVVIDSRTTGARAFGTTNQFQLADLGSDPVTYTALVSTGAEVQLVRLASGGSRVGVYTQGGGSTPVAATPSQGTVALALTLTNGMEFAMANSVGSGGAHLAYYAIDILLPLHVNWAVPYGVGGLTENPDGDALNNLGEYAFGGIPTNSLDVGVVPTSNGSGQYRYSLRKAPLLKASVQTTTDLASPVWANLAIQIGANGTNCWGADLDAAYAAGTHITLRSPEIPLPNVKGSPHLSWKQLYDAASGDVMSLEVIAGGGGTTHKVYSFQPSGTTLDRWTSKSVPLGSVTGPVVLQFHFDAASWEIGGRGWYIDDGSIAY